METLLNFRMVLAILLIVSTLSLIAEGQLFSSLVDSSKRLLMKTTKVKTTVSKKEVLIDDAPYLSVAAEAGKTRSSGSPAVSLNIALNLKGTYNSCGCGGDRCAKFGKCRISGYNPICCSNKCMCVQATVEAIAERLETTCLLCDLTSPLLSVICREASIIEFNCWTNYKDVNTESAKNTYQYSYF